MFVVTAKFIGAACSAARARRVARLRRVSGGRAVSVDELPAGVTNTYDEPSERQCADSGDNSRGSTGNSTEESRQRKENDARRGGEERLGHLLVRLDDSFGHDAFDTVALCSASLDGHEGTQGERGGADDWQHPGASSRCTAANRPESAGDEQRKQKRKNYWKMDDCRVQRTG